ncbi:MAG: hypothetical protein JWM39_303 [Parcubacteria group bacterium]|nr:hypothetical protein [Parcubacteria group bacterium]
MQEEKMIYEGFLITILLKGAISIIEVLSGIAILFVPSAKIYELASALITNLPLGSIGAELLDQVGSYTPDTLLFVAGYLFIRGIVKAVLISALLLNKLWAYPSLLLVMGGFVLYQIYQILNGDSIIVIGITVFDLIVMYFVWREYQIVLKRLQAGTVRSG